jgi:hypothetical protein
VPESFVGIQVIEIIHGLLLGLILVFVPAITADCIARERREGTLGLLFLTPLTASGIVLGKILARTLRALTLWLAVLPVLTIPFFYGTVTWADVTSILSIELCAGMMGLAAGVLASSLTDSRALAFTLAYLLVATFAVGSRQYQDWRTMISILARPLPKVTYGSFASPSTPTSPASLGLAPAPLSPAIMAKDIALAAILLLVSFRFAGWRVELSWRDRVPTLAWQNRVKRFCASRFGRRSAARTRRMLEWNPVAWLQQYSWRARLSKWGLCLLFVALGCAVLVARIRPYTLDGLLTTLLLILAAAYTFAGVNGLLQAKRNGTLELILVSPLPVDQIVFGRVWGLWQQFLPSVILLAGSDLALHMMIPPSAIGQHAPGPWTAAAGWFWIKGLEIIMVYLMLPFFATYCALQVKNLLLASALAWLALLLPPFATSVLWDEVTALGLVPASAGDASAAAWTVLAGNILTAWFAHWLLRHGLFRRGHPF